MKSQRKNVSVFSKPSSGPQNSEKGVARTTIDILKRKHFNVDFP